MMEETIDGSFLVKVTEQITQALSELQIHPNFSRCRLLVVGCSTSEVIGKHIGTAGTTEVAETIFRAVTDFADKSGVAVAFQCCEHLNRALIMEASVMERYGYDEVAVVPALSAGGALAAYAYKHFPNGVVVERIAADAGIDMGDTLIGMHLKPVAVPVRSQVKQIGKAHLTMAVTRPKYIGGPRAVY
ncbi:TIGR01440 family protein [Peribacillus faecalis]